LAAAAVYHPLVLLGVLALALTAAGCADGNGGGTPAVGTTATAMPAGTPTTIPPSASPAATPRPGEASGWEGFREFADKMEAGLAAGDVEFLVDRAHFSAYACPGPEESSPCQQEGQVLQVITIAPVQQIEPTLVEVDVLRDNFQRLFDAAQSTLSDSYGDGALRLYSISRRGQEGGDQEYRAVITLMSSSNESPQRELLLLRFRFQDGRWEYNTVLQGALSEGLGVEKYFSQAPEDLNWEKRQ